MSREELSSRYQLLEEIAAGATTSYHALAHTGVVVMAHFLGGDEERRAEILARVERLPRAPDGKVIEVTESDGRPVVVTKFILEFESFESWLDSVETPDSEPGEFTRMFKRPDLPEDRSAEDEAPAPERDDEPGEFTRLFDQPDLGEGGEAPSPGDGGESPSPTGETPPASGEGSSAVPDDASSGPPSPPARSEPGEFTRMFRGLDADAAEAEERPAGEEPAQARPTDEAPAEEGGPTRAEPDAPDPLSPPPDAPPPPEPPSPPRTEASEPPSPRRTGPAGSPSSPEPPPPPRSEASEPGSPPRTPSGPAEPGSPGPSESPEPIPSEAPPEPPARAPSEPPPEKKAPDPPPPAPPSPPREADETGEFTREIRRRSERSGSQGPPPRPRLDGPDASPDAAPPSRPRARGDGGEADYRSRLYDAGEEPEPGGPGGSGSGGPGGPSLDLPREQGPSDYTRIVAARGGASGGGPSSGAPPRPAPPPPTPEPAAGSPLWPFILGLVAVVLAAGAVVLYFALAGGAGE